MLHEHRVLTTDQITTMTFPSPRAARRRLLELYGWNVVDRFQPLVGVGSAPMHYVLGATGAAVLAAEVGITTAALGYRRDDVLAIAHQRTLAHTVAINDVFAHLVQHSIISTTSSSTTGRSATTGVRLQAWWSETRCLRLVGDFARPDAYGRITLAPAPAPALSAAAVRSWSFQWFFELDFGTEPLPRVAAKLDGYAELAATTQPIPVLIWLPSPQREAHAREHLTRALRRLERPDLVPIATTTPAALLYPHPPEGPSQHSWSVHEDLSAERRTALPGHAEPAVLGWLPIDLDHDLERHHAGTGHLQDRHGENPHYGAGPRRGLDGLAERWPAASDTTPAGFVVPDRARARTVELPAPDPVPPGSAMVNPPMVNPAVIDSASSRAVASTAPQLDVAVRGRGGGCAR
jgi:hypothetical protein